MIYFVTNRTNNLVVDSDKVKVQLIGQVNVQLVGNSDKLPPLNQLTYKGTNLVGLDLETTGLSFYKDDILLIVLGNETDQYVLDWYGLKNDSNFKLSDLFQDSKLSYLGHNLLFDLPFLMHRGVDFSIDQVCDTMIAEQILIKGTKKSASLKDTLKRRLGITEVNKAIRMEFVAMKNGVPIFDNRHIEYASGDIEFLSAIYGKQNEHLTRLKQLDLLDLNNKNVGISAKMGLKGMYVDRDAWMKLYYANLKKADELEIRMDEELVSLGFGRIKKRVKVRFEQTDLFGGIGVDVVNKSINHLNYASPAQCLDVFKAFKLPIPKSVKEDKNSVGEATLQQYLLNHPTTLLKDWIKLLIEYKVTLKLTKSFGKKWLEEHLDGNSRVHASFTVNRTATGRYSCIEANQMVMLVGGYKKIKDVKIGDSVYSYDENGKLKINKVLDKFYQGHKRVIKLNYISKGGNKKTGSLICTPDHMIRINQGEWVQAKDILVGDKIWHVYRDSSVRPRLYGVNSFMKLEQDIIKSEFFKVSPEFHLHHIDKDKGNNNLNNLAILTASAHTKIHAQESGFKKGNTNKPAVHSYTNPIKINRTKYQLLNALMVAKGRPTKVSMDFGVFINKCKSVGIDVNEVSKRFSKLGYLSKAKIKKALFQSKTTEEASKLLKIGTLRLKELCNYYNILYSNHKLVSIEELSYADVYDLSIENDSNFIVEDLNVHNCSNPNLQQIPSIKEFRQCFKAPEGRKIWTCDYSSAELRILASLSRDEAMLRILSEGGDLHGYVATPVYRYLFKDETAIVDKNNNGGFRTKMKNVIFGLLYGAGVNKIAELLDISSMKAEQVYQILQKTFPEAFDYLDKMSSFGVNNGYIIIEPILNQRRWFQEYFDNGGYLTKSEKGSVERACKNTPIQATNGQMMKQALIYVDNYITENKLSSFIVSTVHDEMVVEVGEGEEPHVEAFKSLMKKAGDEFLSGVEMEVEDKVLECWSK
jgi:DNA polymerase I-like protein with 3'-5' exonuclease and polymerase domains